MNVFEKQKQKQKTLLRKRIIEMEIDFRIINDHNC